MLSQGVESLHLHGKHDSQKSVLSPPDETMEYVGEFEDECLPETNLCQIFTHELIDDLLPPIENKKIEIHHKNPSIRSRKEGIISGILGQTRPREVREEEIEHSELGGRSLIHFSNIVPDHLIKPTVKHSKKFHFSDTLDFEVKNNKNIISGFIPDLDHTLFKLQPLTSINNDDDIIYLKNNDNVKEERNITNKKNDFMGTICQEKDIPTMVSENLNFGKSYWSGHTKRFKSSKQHHCDSSSQHRHRPSNDYCEGFNVMSCEICDDIMCLECGAWISARYTQHISFFSSLHLLSLFIFLFLILCSYILCEN